MVLQDTKENNEMPSVEELTARLKELYGESYIELCSTGLGDVHAIHILDPNCKVAKGT